MALDITNMANEEHLKIFKHGAVGWNDWRVKHPNITPDLSSSNLSGTRMATANLSNSDLSNTNLGYSDLGSANFDNAQLRKANLTGARLPGAQFIKANLVEASLRKAIMIGANLTEADLSSATLFHTNLSDSKLHSSKLNQAILESVTFTGAELFNADFTNAIIGWSNFGNNDLSTIKGLDTVIHRGPNTIGIDTVYRSKGKISEIFLRRAGVPENFINHIASFTNPAFEFYSCFISFTEKDDMFSERLYNDLQAAGVRCWRWKEDARWGKRLLQSIDEAVWVYDKLVVICSEYSLNSPAVIREIERALQKEDELARLGQQADVLFPIRIDDYIFTGWNHYRRADVITKNVGDFQQWKEPELYIKALTRLIHDLGVADSS